MLSRCLLIVLLAPAFGLAQPVVKGYAWSQTTARGAKPSAVAGESGNANKSVIAPGKLSIYIEHKNGQRILPFRVWINGQPYRVNNNMVSKTPVVRERPGVGTSSDYDTLVAATSNKVIHIEAAAPVKNISIPLSKGVPRKPDGNKIWVEYYWRAKTYAYAIPEIKMLEAVRLQ
jgi:hypothetical protein